MSELQVSIKASERQTNIANIHLDSEVDALNIQPYKGLNALNT